MRAPHGKSLTSSSRRWRLRHLGAWLTIALLAAALLGCGGGKATKAEKARYVARVNAECKVLEGQIHGLSQVLRHFEQKIREGVALAEQSNARLRAIPVPKGEKLPREWLQVRETVVALIKRLIYAKPASAERRQAAAEEVLVRNKEHALARTYGLTGCLRTG